MSRIGLYSHTPSEAVRVLNECLQASRVSSRILLRGGASNFRGRESDFIINYGASDTRTLNDVTNLGKIINTADAVRAAANKDTAFHTFLEKDVKTVEFTRSRNLARDWVNSGKTVFCRTELNGHSGAGILLCTNDENPGILGDVEVRNSRSMPHAHLYTVGVPGRHRELRVHVAFGEVILQQQKRRRDGYREMENYSEVVRNYDRGWIYSPTAVTSSDAIKAEAIKAVSSLGLDFGAVDIITQGDDFWILEVNTAPGLSGESSRTAYSQAFVEFFADPTSFTLNMDLQVDDGSFDSENEGEGGSVHNRFLQNLIREMDDATNTMEEANRARESQLGGSSDDTMPTRVSDPVGDPERYEFVELPTGPDDNPWVNINRELLDDATATFMADNPGMYNPVATTPPPAPVQNVAPPTPLEADPVEAPVEAPATPSVSPFEGTGHYIVTMISGRNTVVYVAPDGTIYTSEYDLVLQEDAVTVLSKIAV